MIKINNVTKPAVVCLVLLGDGTAVGLVDRGIIRYYQLSVNKLDYLALHHLTLLHGLGWMLEMGTIQLNNQ